MRKKDPVDCRLVLLYILESTLPYSSPDDLNPYFMGDVFSSCDIPANLEQARVGRFGFHPTLLSSCGRRMRQDFGMDISIPGHQKCPAPRKND